MMNKQPKKPLLITLLFVITGLFAVGCGDDNVRGKLPELPPHMRGNNATQAAPIRQSDGMVPVPNEKWDRVKSFFENYAGTTTTDRSDPFRNNLTRYAQKPDLPTVTEESTDESEEKPVVIASPLERYPVEEFSLILVMSGTAKPKAVVMDPMGTPWVVRPDTLLGNKGGLVQAITQYSIVVAEPGADAPSEITIRPLILDDAAELVTSGEEAFSSKPLTSASIR